MKNQLKGQVAIVTGGARGIGEAVCQLFCKEGARVILWDIIDDGVLTADKINEAGGEIEFQKIDITNRQEVQGATEKIMKRFGRIDILINNAGIVRDRSFLKMSDQEWDQVINVNLNGVYNCSKAVIPHMVNAGYGRIVSASSINGLQGAFGQTNYSASKAAIIGFTRSLAKEVGKNGITVNAVAPGFVLTDMTKTMPEDVLKSSIDQIPVKRAGTVDDIAHAFLYLASANAGFVSGHTLSVNGGML